MLFDVRWRRLTPGRLWPGMPSDLHVRRRNIPGFTYRSLAYAIIDDVIWIVAVVHERKPPGYWRDRVRDLPDL
jgi:hypothetical protein